MPAEKEQDGQMPSIFASPALPKDPDSPSLHPVGSSPYIDLSSPEPTPSEPTEIFMISPPDSLDNSVEQELDDNLVFLTPPEHQRRMSSSSDDQNAPDEVVLCGNAVKIVVSDSLKRARVLGGASEDQSELKKIRVSGPELDGQTKETVVGSEQVDYSGEEMCSVNLADDAAGEANVDGIGVGSVGGIEVLVDDCVPKVAAIDEALEVERKCGAPGSSLTGGSSDIDKIGDANVKLKCVIIDNVIDETGQGRGRSVGNVEIVAEAAADGKRSEEIDEVILAGKKLVGVTSNVAGIVSESMNQDKENDGGVSGVGTVKGKKGLLEFLDALKVIVRSLNNTLGDKEVDFLETARRRGMTFPRPRWRPPEDDE